MRVTLIKYTGLCIIEEHKVEAEPEGDELKDARAQLFRPREVPVAGLGLRLHQAEAEENI